MESTEKFKEMARRNDIARKLGLNVVLTKKAARLPRLEDLLRFVREFNAFNKKDDPYGWHDLGYFNWDDDRVLWKIDYYDDKLIHFENPLSESCKECDLWPLCNCGCPLTWGFYEPEGFINGSLVDVEAETVYGWTRAHYNP